MPRGFFPGRLSSTSVLMVGFMKTTLFSLALLLALPLPAQTNSAGINPRWSYTYYSLNSQPLNVVVADVNLDGKKDLVVLTSSQIAVFLGNGNGTFHTVPLYSPLAAHAQTQQSIVSDYYGNIVADFNGDKKPDLATSSGVYAGTGDGHFHFLSPLPATDQPLYLGVGGDFNRDGKADLIAWNTDTPPANQYTLLGKGNGTFTIGAPVNIGFYGAGPAIAADLNKDGKLDLITVVNNKVESPYDCPQSVYVEVGNGDGTFGPPQPVGNGECNGGPIGLGDVNGDNKIDLIATGSSGNPSSNLLTYLGKGDGTFQKTPYSQAFGMCSNFLMGDLDGDGLSDLFCATNTGTSVYLSQGNGTYFAGPTTTNGNSNALALTDFNGDGARDAVVLPFPGATGSDAKRVLVLLNLSGTTVIPTTNPARLVYKQPFSLSATVQPSLSQNSDSPPDGTVTFKNRTTLLGTAAVGSDVSVPNGLGVGTYTLTAAYSGDYEFNPHTVTFVKTVVKASSRTALTSSANPSTYHSSVKFTVRVTPQYAGMPMGSITFKDGARTLTTVSLNTSSTATYTTSSLARGKHAITATYNGNGNFQASTSAVLSQSVK